MNAHQTIDWYEAETKAHEAVDALRDAARLVSDAISDVDSAHFIETKRIGDVVAAHLIISNIVHLLGKGSKS